MTGSERTILLSAGGTGGHVFPALALASELREEGATVVWAGRPDGLECRVAAEAGFRFEPLSAAGFFGKGLLSKARALLLLASGVIHACRLLRRLDPDAVVATGGYATAGVLAATWLTGVPYFLLEQNCIPGRVTRRLAGRARESFLGLPTADPFPGRHSVTGTPLRGALLGVAEQVRPAGGPTVLIIGGSLGARALNQAAVTVAARVVGCRFVILAGRRDCAAVAERVAALDAESRSRIRVVEFTSRPEELYREASVAVSRAGGVVLAELAVFGIPCVLVPFPHAVDRHQDANAAYFVRQGAAEVVAEAGEDIDSLAGRLAAAVEALLADDGRRARMVEAMKRLARPDAGKAIAGRIMACLAE
jgi:UDP-N-acetylglucosamine--N-acetylmuramyl-(pentapeptide) pyrophosphoryl-undecaprenol N-acetylglucosamine transferase